MEQTDREKTVCGFLSLSSSSSSFVSLEMRRVSSLFATWIKWAKWGTTQSRWQQTISESNQQVLGGLFSSFVFSLTLTQSLSVGAIGSFLVSEAWNNQSENGNSNRHRPNRRHRRHTRWTLWGGILFPSCLLFLFFLFLRDLYEMGYISHNHTQDNDDDDFFGRERERGGAEKRRRFRLRRHHHRSREIQYFGGP